MEIGTGARGDVRRGRMRSQESDSGRGGDQIVVVAKRVANVAGELLDFVALHDLDRTRLDLGGRNAHALPHRRDRHEPVGGAVVGASQGFPVVVVLGRQGQLALGHLGTDLDSPRRRIPGVRLQTSVGGGAGGLILAEDQMSLREPGAVGRASTGGPGRCGESQSQQGQGAAKTWKAFHG